MRVSLSVLLALFSSTTAFTVVQLASGTRPTRVTSPSRRTRVFSETEEKNGIFSEDVQQEAREVLEKVGWARPMQGEGELTSDDPFVQQINAGIQRDFGVDLDDLLNPAKVRKTLLFCVG